MLISHERILSDEIVLMEDSIITQQSVKDILEKEYGWKVKVVDRKDDAIFYAEKQHTIFFILDVHMGVYREQEGLDALEEIKSINENAFTCIFSAKKDSEKLARRLKVDFFLEKTRDIEKDVKILVTEILKYQIKCLDLITQSKHSILEKIDVSSKVDATDTLEKTKQLNPDADPNISSYNRLAETPEWADRLKGRYVAFVEGNYVDNDVDREKLLSRLSDKYPGNPRFIKRIIKEYKVPVDIPIYDINR
jgi:response regulator RpfG family c-di-GMP phosphodiesterase